MGIPGLTTYISKNTGIFYKDHSLHDTLLLIDGNSLACQIYLTLTVTNSAFGGDYERLRHSIEKFLKLLLSCNVLPIVVFDGGYETRKLKTTVSRLKTTILGVNSFKSVNQQNNVKLFPMFMKEVFKQVTRDLLIPCVQSDLEADFDLVYLSRKFQCPILSYDSDFYLNNIEYIPFYNIELKGGKDCRASSTGKALYCKVYRVEHLFRHFGGLSNDFIPLLQCMLGNDYISHMHFRSFLSQLNFRFTSGQKSPVCKRLAVLIKWCRSQQSLESALGKIIEILKFHRKSEAVKQLKRSILDYKTEECILYPYVMEQIVQYNQSEKLEELQEIQKLRRGEIGHRKYNNSTQSIVQEKDIDNSICESSELEDENETDTEDGPSHEDNESRNSDEIEDNHKKLEEDNESYNSSSEITCNIAEEESPHITNRSKQESTRQFNSNYLGISWLVDEFRHCNLSAHVANMFNLGTIFLSPLRENIKLDSVHVASYPVLESLGKLLLGDLHKSAVLKVYTREIARMKVVRLKCSDDEAGDLPDKSSEHNDVAMNGAAKEKEDKSKWNCKSTVLGLAAVDRKYKTSESDHECALKDMPDYELAFRRYLLLNYLQLSHIDAKLFSGDLFPQKWNLFIISIIYWCNNSDHVNRYHISCLVTSFIYLNIVQSHCGYFESKGNFNRKYAKKLIALKTGIENEKIERKKSKKSAKKRSGKENQIVNGDSTDLLSDGVNKNIENNQEICSTTCNDFLENKLKSRSFENKVTANDITTKELQESSTIKSILKIVDANTININELILLYEQLFQLSHFDERLRSNHTKFNKDVIHVFCEFQSIFYFISMFNSVLKFPFQELEMSKIYSGTFLYNVYCKIYSKDNCIPLLFEHCDDMFNVYRFVMSIVENNTETDVFKVNSKKVKRKKKKKDKVREEESEEKGEVEMSEEEEILIDSDNIYSLLQDVRI